MGLHIVARRAIKRIKRSVRDIRRIRQLTSDPRLNISYYPLEPRKSKPSIIIDLLWWYLRYKDVNEYYYVYGFDRRCVNMNDYLPYPKFRSIRNRRNRYPDAITDFNYICILQDKFVFSQLLLSLGVPTPKVLAFCKPDKIFWLDDMKPRPIQALCESDRRFDGFCKPLMGTNGRGAFPLRVTEGQVYIGSNKATAGEIRGRINGLYLIQERISQHSAMSALHPQSLNTMRVVTFNTGDRVSVFSAAQRVGTNGRQVDNWSAGGILIGVELKTGRLRADGFYKPGYGSKVQEHPQTGVRFLGFEIPYFREALELVLQVHEYFYGVHSIGWDIAISERGPVIIEANDDWDGAVAMALERNFRKRFFEMFLSTTNPIFGPD